MVYVMITVEATSFRRRRPLRAAMLVMVTFVARGYAVTIASSRTCSTVESMASGPSNLQRTHQDHKRQTALLEVKAC